MTKPTKTTKIASKKERTEEVMTPAGKFIKIYSGKKFVAMLTEQEFEARKNK